MNELEKVKVEKCIEHSRQFDNDIDMKWAMYSFEDGFDAGVLAERERILKILNDNYWTIPNWERTKKLIQMEEK